MRLFLAIDLPQELQLRLDRLLSALRPEALIKWSPLDNLHVTVKFVGEWPEERLGELHEALVSLPRRSPIGIEVENLGWFPNARSPRVLWAGIQGAEALKALARDTEEALERIGIPPEERDFSPHLTLARIKNPVPLGRLRQRIEEMRPVTLGTFQASRFALFRSDPGSNSSIYRKLHEYRFEAAMAAAAGSEQ